VLVCDDERTLREMLRVLVRRAGYQSTVVDGVTAARKAISEREIAFDAVITDLMMPDGSGIDVLEAAKARSDATQVVMITAHATTERAVEAMRKGAYDYLEKPFDNRVLLATLEKALEKGAMVGENRRLRDAIEGRDEGMIGVSRAMRELREVIARAAEAPTSVLITGESGTGKELAARALHDWGERGTGPFVVVNCGALPENLMESELFGHVKGAFTGASGTKEGLIRAASGGTLFLDEIGELPLSLQVKLLRVLQERKVRPVGGSDEVPVDVRVVAATNRDLESEIEEGSFREDLFYRLNVIRIRIPPLRERPDDIRPLAQHLLEKHSTLQGRRRFLSEEAMDWLVRQPFPGNVRELENRIERAVALSPGELMGLEDIRPEGPASSPGTVAAPAIGEGFDLEAHLAAVERAVLYRALEASGGVRKRAAELLGMTFRQFRYRLAKHESDPGDSVE
jgi:two-component system response regulator PilR (NtrC family)